MSGSDQLHSSLISSHLDFSRVWELMCTAKAMTDLYEQNNSITSKYVHATSRGHEAIQLALGIQLKPQDFVFPYYRDDAMLLGIGMKPFDLMLQLLAKRDDPFSGGRTYYSHPSLRDADKPKIPHQSSATGMQAIPATGAALGFWYQEQMGLSKSDKDQAPISVCSLGDASITEGEVAEAFQMAVLKSLPILYLVQDNEWDISAHASEFRAMDASEYARGFKGLEVRTIDGTDFVHCYQTLQEVIELIRTERRPFLVHAKVPLLNHHTSGVRKEWYRDDLELAGRRDPIPKFRQFLSSNGYTDIELTRLEEKAIQQVNSDFQAAVAMPDPVAEDLELHMFAETEIQEETGERAPQGKMATVMVDCALFAVRELMEKHPECLLYGQDVGARLGGVFREAATLAKTFGSHRVFNTPIQEAFIVGSTVGMSAVGLKPIVEVQFADYIWPGLNQLFTELSRSNYLSNGKWPVSCILRVPIGAYGSGGPYHSSSVESVVLQIRGVKVGYPSTGADLKGLLKAAYYDPNPVVMFEHKGLYWSKIKGTEGAKTIEPDSDYVVPFGKARVVLQASDRTGPTAVIITYGRGVYWALEAAESFKGRIEVLDLRSLNPWDKEAVFKAVSDHGRALVLTEEPLPHSFAMALAGEIQSNCFQDLDAPIATVGSANTPAIPLNSTLEAAAIPNAEKVRTAIETLLRY
jgi:2-oxoisovalerate dehydrogenase E1 component